MTEKENHDNITRLFENLKVRERRRRKRKWYNRKLGKFTLTQWMIFALIVINLTTLVLHVYNTIHVQEILEFRKMNGAK